MQTPFSYLFTLSCEVQADQNEIPIHEEIAIHSKDFGISNFLCELERIIIGVGIVQVNMAKMQTLNKNIQKIEDSNRNLTSNSENYKPCNLKYVNYVI